jgi:hypothetical protein
MADFCWQCTEELFDSVGGVDNDFSTILDSAEDKENCTAAVLCEGCGPTRVDHTGKCTGDCMRQHGGKMVVQNERKENGD